MPSRFGVSPEPICFRSDASHPQMSDALHFAGRRFRPDWYRPLKTNLLITAVTRSAANLALLVTVIAVLLGCSGGGSSVVTVTSVSITPGAASVQPGAQTDFTATVNLSNTTATSSTSTAVAWEVNGTVGGNSSVGTIVSSITDNQVGIYTAPAVVPSTNNGQVNVTAVAQQSSTTTSTTTGTSSGAVTSNVTSNTAVVTIGVTPGFSLNPSISSVPAGGSVQFSAVLNGAADRNTAWSVSSAGGGNPGSIGGQSGLYLAPLSPPPGNSITVTGTDGTNSLSDSFTIVFSDHSLSGPYAFSYTGDNQLGFQAVAGSFVADGNGNIESGVEDIDSFQTGVSKQVPVSGNYVVGQDGRGSANFSNGSTWRFALATNQHGLIIRSDAGDSGGGTIDQQSIGALSTTNANSVLSGPYVFSGLGADAAFGPLAIAGKFTSDGAGNIPAANSIVDMNDAGSVTRADTTLNGSYFFDTTFPGTGRGTLILSSAATGTRMVAFYVTDSTLLHFVEIDHNGYLAGRAFSAPAGSSFSVANLASGNYAFTTNGNSSAGAYAAGGIFTADGNGNMTGGVFDGNNAGTVQSNAALSSCPYSVDATTGRIDLKLCGAGASEFAAYRTNNNSALLLQLDPAAISTGVAFQQQGSAATPAGSFALSLVGRGVFHNVPALYQEDVVGQVIFNASTATGGNLDIDNFTQVFAADIVNTGTISATSNGVTTTAPASPIGAPAANGRGTLVLTGTSPVVTYDLVYYLIGPGNALLLDVDKTFVLTGVLLNQF
jgi:hypothetical protein